MPTVKNEDIAPTRREDLQHKAALSTKPAFKSEARDVLYFNIIAL
jgi:hypothetical protein